MKHLSLFSGIGGFDLAAEWMGWENVAHCEIDPFCRKVLKYYWPKANTHEDIKTTDFTQYAGTIDIITGGDRCQPHSKSGKLKGMADIRYLWPEYFRAVREVYPRYLVNENVRNTINNGVLDQKISELESIGYSCWPPMLIPSSSQSIHERYRVWLVAYSNKDANSDHNRAIQAKTGAIKTEKQRQNREWVRPKSGPVLTEHNWKEIATRICRNTDELPLRMDKHRNGAIGNAIDPIIAHEIFKAIEIHKQI